MKRLTSILLAMLMTASILSSCSDSASDAVDTTASDTTAVEGTTEIGSTAPPSAVPDGLDFNGQTFRLLGGDAVFTNYTMATELNGDRMNDSLYDRYSEVGSILNVEFDFLQENAPGAVEKLTSTVLAGDDTYHLAIVQRQTKIADMVSQNMLYNFNDMPYIDLSMDCWYHDANESLRVDDLIYYTYGDIYPLSAHVFYYNKDIVSSYGLDSPHDFALSGLWTIDKMTEMAVAVSKDINGDGIMDANDQYGVSFAFGDTLSSMMFGCGITLTKKDDSGVMLSECDERMVEAFNKIYALTNTSNSGYMKEFNVVNLNTGRVLFYTGTIHQSKNYRDSEIEFGLLPYPKFNEEQENYISFLNTELMCIPSSADKEFAGAVIQLLAEQSGDVKIAYYENLLQEKVARDPESIKVLDLIFDNAINDFAISYCGGASVSSITANLISAGQNNFVSAYEIVASAAQQKIDDVYEMIIDSSYN